MGNKGRKNHPENRMEHVLHRSKKTRKKVEILLGKVYWEYRESLKREIPIEMLAEKDKIREETLLAINARDGRQFPAGVIVVEDKNIILDLNRCLASKTIYFTIKILSIERIRGNDKEEKYGKRI